MAKAKWQKTYDIANVFFRVTLNSPFYLFIINKAKL